MGGSVIESSPEKLELGGLVRAMRRADPSDVADAMASAAASLGGADLVLYVVDFEQQVLEPLPNRSAHEELPHSEDVNSTVAGRAFLQREVVAVERADGTRVWAPIVEGSDVTGVLALTLPAGDPAVLAQCEDLGVLAGFALAIQSRVTDTYGLHRRRKSMSLAASMQWDLLPPLTLATPRVAVAGMLEPAYEVGGDCFDYALNGSQLDFAFMDSMGHGLRSAMLAALALGCYRHDRRESRTLEHIHESVDRVVASEHRGDGFVTGQIGRLDLDSGVLHWINAGHPAPMLIRHGQVVGELVGPPTGPWGTGHGVCTVHQEPLEPGDGVLFYTDGITEGRGTEGFGTERLIDLVDRCAFDEVPIPLIVRHLVRAVVEHHEGALRDDATVLIVRWQRPADDAADR